MPNFLPNSKYSLSRVLGNGAFGDAYLVRDENDHEYVMKYIFDASQLKAGELATVNEEAQVMCNLDHPNVTKYYELFELGHGRCALILEYSNNGTLREKLNQAKTKPAAITVDNIREWMRQITDGIEHIHRLLLAHRDLKPENIFLTKHDEIKIGDFGLSLKLKERSGKISGFAGSLLYTAPEVFNDDEYTYRCDLWSLGVILYELITLKQPFVDETTIMDGYYKKLDDTVDEDLRSAVELLLNMEPRERPRAGEITAMLGGSGRLLDLAFIMDYTGSMQRYIDETTKIIEDVVKGIMYHDESCYARVALIKYRDHPPPGKTAGPGEFVKKVHNLTRNIEKIKKALTEDKAEEQEDNPEAVADGLEALLHLSWRPTSHRVAVLVLDAPPHGVGEDTDSYPNGCPCGLDPVKVCHELRNNEIKLYVFGCNLDNLADFMDLLAGFAHITGGKFKPLEEAGLLKNLTYESTIDSIKAPTTEAEVRKLLDQIKLVCMQSEELNIDHFVAKSCEELKKKCRCTVWNLQACAQIGLIAI